MFMVGRCAAIGPRRAAVAIDGRRNPLWQTHPLGATRRPSQPGDRLPMGESCRAAAPADPTVVRPVQPADGRRSEVKGRQVLQTTASGRPCFRVASVARCGLARAPCTPHQGPSAFTSAGRARGMHLRAAASALRRDERPGRAPGRRETVPVPQENHVTTRSIVRRQEREPHPPFGHLRQSSLRASW